MPGYLPAALAQQERFCRWLLTASPGGKPTKMPDQSTRDLSLCRSWKSLETAPRSENQGTGLVFTDGIFIGEHQLVGIDLDACRDPVTRELAPWAYELHALLEFPWSQTSPSGRGVHFFVLVNPNLLVGLRAHGVVPFPPMLNCGDKKTDIQLFTNHGYLSITLQSVERLAAVKEITIVPDEVFLKMVEKFGLRGDEDSKVKLQAGEGAPPTMDEIAVAVTQRKHGLALIDGNWKDVVGAEKSASDAFFMLEGYVLEAARFHMPQAVEFLLGHTAWGMGEIEDSKDPGKYTRAPWVKSDIVRVASRWKREEPVEFEVITPEESPPPKNGTHQPTEKKGKKPQIAFTSDQVLDGWKKDRPLVHLSTGIESLDKATGGGFVLGSRVFCVGAPDAWKTGFMVQIIDNFLQQGIPCGILGVDEEPSDIQSRFLQRRHISRVECEAGGDALIARGKAAMAGLPLVMFDPDASIEEAGEALHNYAKQLRPGSDLPACVLLVDSVQVAKKFGEDPRGSDTLYRLVTERVRALRKIATKYRMLVIATSEMSRAGYKSKKQEDQANDLASAKESGAIEFSAKVQLVLRCVPGTHDVIELRIAKNKHGPSTRPDQDGIFLRVNRDTQTLVEDSSFEPVDVEDVEEGERKQRLSQKRNSDVIALGKALIWRTEPMSVREAARELNVHHDRISDARAHLRELGALVEKAGPRGAVLLTLLSEKLPEDLRAQMLL